MKTYLKMFAGVLGFYVWALILFHYVPVLLTSGSVHSVVALALIALTVGVPVVYIGKKIRAYFKEQPK